MSEDNNYYELELNKNYIFLIASIFFEVINIIIYASFACLFGFNIKQKLNINFSMIILLDFLLRIINTLAILPTYLKGFILLNEIFNSIIASYQFFLVFEFYSSFFKNKIINININFLKIDNKFVIFFIFFGFIFEYDTHTSYYIKALYATNYFAIIAFLFFLYKYISTNYLLYSFISENIREKYYNYLLLRDFIIHLPFISYICYIIYFNLKLLSLFIENKLHLNYIEMICIFPKEIGKYCIFIFLGIIYYTLDTNISNDIKAINKNDNKKGNKVQIFKNEENIDNDKQILK